VAESWRFGKYVTFLELAQEKNSGNRKNTSAKYLCIKEKINQSLANISFNKQ
jgi:hypothetical protein